MVADRYGLVQRRKNGSREMKIKISCRCGERTQWFPIAPPLPLIYKFLAVRCKRCGQIRDVVAI